MNPSRCPSVTIDLELLLELFFFAGGFGMAGEPAEAVSTAARDGQSRR